MPPGSNERQNTPRIIQRQIAGLKPSVISTLTTSAELTEFGGKSPESLMFRSTDRPDALPVVTHYLHELTYGAAFDRLPQLSSRQLRPWHRV